MQKKYILALIIIIIFIFPLNLSGAENNFNQTYQRKSPFLAGIFSWYHPGLGQFYVGETKKATIFWLSENILLFSVILNIADIKFAFKRDFGFEFSIKLKNNPSNTRIATTIGLGVILIALHIYNIIDAIGSAQLYNQKIFARQFELSQKSFSIEAFAYNDVNGIKLVKRF